jgi:hypothetical protein
MHHTHRARHRLVLVPLVAAALVACGGGDSEQEPADTDAESSVVDAEPAPAPTDAPADDGSGVQPDPVAVEACLEGAGLTVRNQDEVDVPYTDEQLDFFELDTELLVEGGDTEFISGSIGFYRSMEKADAQEVVFEESVTDYTVGRAGTVVYTLVGGTEGGELDTVVATIDGCLAQE